MKKRAFGILELLIVLIIITTLYFVCYKPHKNLNPFDDGVSSEQVQQVEKKISEIEKQKLIKQKIEENLNKEY